MLSDPEALNSPGNVPKECAAYADSEPTRFPSNCSHVCFSASVSLSVSTYDRTTGDTVDNVKPCLPCASVSVETPPSPNLRRCRLLEKLHFRRLFGAPSP